MDHPGDPQQQTKVTRVAGGGIHRGVEALANDLEDRCDKQHRPAQDIRSQTQREVPAISSLQTQIIK